MLGGDTGFGVESRERLPAGGPFQPFRTELHFFVIPEGAVLLLEEQQTSRRVEARPQPGGVEVRAD